MKRLPEDTDEEWQFKLEEAKLVSERRMKIEDYKKGFYSLLAIQKAATFWYGNSDSSNQHLAEQRMLKGELPE